MCQPITEAAETKRARSASGSRAPTVLAHFSVERPLERTQLDAAMLVRVTVRRHVGIVVHDLDDVLQLDVGIGLRARDLDGAAGLADDLLGDRAEHEALDPREPFGADEDEVRPDLAR